eukprot:jgi/Astpho2/7522/Aster-x1430
MADMTEAAAVSTPSPMTMDTPRRASTSRAFCMLGRLCRALVRHGDYFSALPGGTRPEGHKVRLPLASFDALLRVVGPLLPFLALAARMAVQVWIGAQQDHWRGWTEAGLVYAAVTVSRGAIYLTHRAGRRDASGRVRQLNCMLAWQLETAVW